MSLPHKIIKFSGSLLTTPESLQSVREVIHATAKESKLSAVVASASTADTNRLYQLCQLASTNDPSYPEILEQLSSEQLTLVKSVFPQVSQTRVIERLSEVHQGLTGILRGISLVKDLTPKLTDAVVSFAEQAAAVILSEFLSIDNEQYYYLDARQLVLTEDNFSQATVIQPQTSARIRSYFAEQSAIPVVTGFIGSTASGESTTLGRGGADYSAAIFGSALDVDEIVLWTGVDGVLTADPEKVDNTFCIPHLGYLEAMELCHFGAKVVHPLTIQLAHQSNIPIRIKNIKQPDKDGTLISARLPSSEVPITGISSIPSVLLFRLEGSGLLGQSGIAERLFRSLSAERISVILISQASSEHSICFALKPADGERGKAAIEREFAPEMSTGQVDALCIEPPKAVIAVVGANMRHTPGIAGQVFRALGKNGVNISAIAQGSSELNISAVIDAEDEHKALNALHDAFFLSDLKTINLFLLGTGLVGTALLGQLAEQRQHFSRLGLQVRIVGLANSRQALISDSSQAGGLSNQQISNLSQAVSPAVSPAGQAMELNSFVRQMKQLNLPNSIFVDCTASDAVASRYADVLQSSIAVVTPNKRANSADYDSYLALKQHAKKANVSYFYETNVGAGLPIIGTLNDLIVSGDEIIKIEAVLSGTLSYIFNSFTTAAGKTFSAVVKEAKAQGYTEPDPRDDLSGTDVARKLLILAREMSVPLELADIDVQSLVTESCAGATSGDEFLQLLRGEDGYFSELLSAAASEGKVLRYIGVVEAGAARVRLEAVDGQHPFYSLSGSDNIISFTTKRYLQRPLVVKGPGAGTEVTAAGVLADIIRAAGYLN